jgi:hypothetical protein
MLHARFPIIITDSSSLKGVIVSSYASPVRNYPFMIHHKDVAKDDTPLPLSKQCQVKQTQIRNILLLQVFKSQAEKQENC